MLNNVSYKKIWQISLPIIISGVAQNIVNVTDTAFLGQVSNVALGAAGNAGILYFVIIITGMGFTTGTQILIGRRNGEQNYKQIGKITDHTFYFIIPFALLLFTIVQFYSSNFLSEIIKSENILIAANQYLDYRIWGIFFAFINFTFIAFFVGTTQTKILSYVTILMMVVNVILDYILIFGHLGFAPMGVSGAALASVISEGIAFLFILGYTLTKVDLNKYSLFKFQKFESKLFFRLFNVSSPIMAQNFLSLSSWFIFFMIIEKIGETELAISHIVRSIYMVLMIPLFGFSNATNTLVSNLIGENRTESVLPVIKKIILLSLACTFVLSLICFFIPELLVSFYTSDSLLISQTVETLRVINITMFFFCVSFILFNGVTGTGNTRASLLIEFINIVIYLASAYYIGITLQSSLPVVWASEFIYFGCLGLLSYLYLKKGNWKSLNI
ncbi:MATE family efflux transporter [Vicingus serpentipes]|uniref:MATE family efflux transporter n=1 Tax=Vicingus serpentipes TaxID=1926625 RepID=UPI00147784DE|nr:MATE family efflux transporter [Vicingus serpentipes]